MNRYLVVFFRHKMPLLGLMGLTLIVSLAVVLVAPRSYQATANLWFDRSPIPDTSPASTYQTPADQATAIFHEYLNSRSFDVSVGHRGPLAAYYDSTGNFPTSDPITPVVHWLEHKPQPTGATRQALVDNGIIITLQKQLIVTLTEPKEVSLAFTFTDPAIAADTLAAFIKEFEVQVKTKASIDAQGTVDFYRAQVTAQQKVVQDADDAVGNYVAAHPQFQSPLVQPDATLTGLRQAQELALQKLTTLTKALDEANVELAAIQGPKDYGFSVVDPPTAPLSATGMLKTALLGIGGGLAVGLLLIAVVCFLLISGDDTAARGRDLQRILGARVVGEVPLVSEAVIVTPPPRKIKALPAKRF